MSCGGPTGAIFGYFWIFFGDMLGRPVQLFMMFFIENWKMEVYYNGIMIMNDHDICENRETNQLARVLQSD